MAKMKKVSDSYTAYAKPGLKLKKMAKGGDLGMKSVKAGFDKNPGVTRADIIVAAKGEARGGKKVTKVKSGAALKKQAAVAIAMKKAGKSPKKKMMGGGMAKPVMKNGGKKAPKKMMGGGRCKYGC